ncbi:hypothetical protein BH09BAC2_BH09BAC2_02370 [soil metagenome]
MTKIVYCILSFFIVATGFSQDVPKKIDLKDRKGDHLMIQLSSDHWTNMPDSIGSHQQGFSRGLNGYFMLDKPFRSSPKFSIGFGLGIGSTNIFFKKMNIDLKSTTTRLPFTAVDSSNHFKKYKLSLSYLEVPLELRFSSNPMANAKSVKVALGVKVGTLINAHTKGKELQNKNNTSINSYTEKENSKRFFNTTRMVGTARVGYGIFSIFGAYQLNNVLKDAAGPAMKSYQVGITISGL